jgi:hypothetical protein
MVSRPWLADETERANYGRQRITAARAPSSCGVQAETKDERESPFVG